MKVTREAAAQNRERIVAAAAHLFRERGFAGIGVADLMREAGLTHGGFYGHFTSKEELMAEASGHALARSLQLWSKAAGNAPQDPLGAFARVYLNTRHRDHPGTGCLIASLGPEVARQGPALRDTVTRYLRSAFDLFARCIPGTPAAKRQKAIATYATLVGALILSRTVDDRALSKEILDASLASITNRTGDSHVRAT